MQVSIVHGLFKKNYDLLFPLSSYKVITKSGKPSDVISPKWKRPGMLEDTCISYLAPSIVERLIY